MLAFIFYSAFITFIVYWNFARINSIENRYALGYTTLSIETILIMEFFFGEFKIISDLILSDWFFFLLFWCYFIYFFFKLYMAYIASKRKDYAASWWRNFHEMSSDLVRKTYVTWVRAYCKPLKNEYAKYWIRKYFDKKLQFRYRLYVNFISYTYILLYIILFFTCLFLNIFMWWLDFPALFTWIRVFFGNHILHFLFCFFIYKLFLSYVFPNMKYRYFVRFHSVLRGFNCGILDSFRISNSFMTYRMIAGRRWTYEMNILSYSTRLLGMKKFMSRFYGRTGPKYWVTLQDEDIFKRYYMPVFWAHYKSIELDELVDTPYHKFKMWIFKWQCLIFTKSVKAYLLKRKLYVNDSKCLELSRYYEHNLKMNYKYKN